jgi:hypothetical protein
MKVRVTLCGFFILAAILSLGAGERITMQVSPRVSLAPANLVVRTMIEANESNRALEIVAESRDFYRSSQISIDGERAPRTEIFEFRNLPGGWYEVRATLLDGSGHTLAYARQKVDVEWGGSSPQ